MPISDYINPIGTVIGGVTSLFDNRSARKEQARQNQKDRDFQLDMWNRANTYNTPTAQMERLKAGGLNPNLVYGNGNSVAQASAPMPSQTKPLPTPNTGQVIGSTINQIIDLQTKRLQNDLVASQVFNTGLMADKIKADTGTSVARGNESIFRSRLIESQNERVKFDLGKERELRQVSIDGQIALMRKTQLQNKEMEINQLTQNQRNQQILNESYAKMLLMKSTLNNQELDNAIKQEILQLRKKGLNESDNVLLRVFSDLLPTKKETGNFTRSYQ